VAREPAANDLERWLRGCGSNGQSCRAATILAKAMDYILKRWPAFTRFLDARRSVVSRAVLRSLLSRVLGLPPPGA
jgi:hypothetical protein